MEGVEVEGKVGCRGGGKGGRCRGGGDGRGSW